MYVIYVKRPYKETYIHRVLQCVAVCCSVLQCVAVCCSVLQYVKRPYKETCSCISENLDS